MIKGASSESHGEGVLVRTGSGSLAINARQALVDAVVGGRARRDSHVLHSLLPVSNVIEPRGLADRTDLG